MGRACNRKITTIALIIFIAHLVGFSVLAQKRPLQLEDFFCLKEVADLQLSPAGDEMTYVLERVDLKANRSVREIWRARTDGKAIPEKLVDDDNISQGRNILRWAPDGKRVAFLSSRSGSPQIWLLTLPTGKAEQATDLPSGVASFEWSPDGRFLAFAAPGRDKSQPVAAAKESDHGIVIDKMNYSIYKLLANQEIIQREVYSWLWLLEVNSHRVEEIFHGGHVRNFVWSPDGKSIAITSAMNSGMPRGADIVIYRVADRRASVALQGMHGQDYDNISSYSAEAWSPDSEQLAVTYREEKDRFQVILKVGIYNPVDGKLTLITDGKEVEPLWPVFHWSERGLLHMEFSHEANRGLFGLSVTSGQVQPIVYDGGYKSNFSFSADGRKIVFVNQNLQQPPEIYLSSSPFKNATKLTSFNNYINGLRLPRTERVKWTAPDGVTVEGLLFLPTNYQSNKKAPLLVMIHGGPPVPMDDRFEPYKAFSTLMAPYPFRMFAERGFAVLIPNYRGSASYGKRFLSPTAEDKEPVEDVMAGIQYLVKRGIADPDKLGIIGQSHGGWLGAYIMTKKRIFKAASLFEGWWNTVSLYGQMVGWLSTNIHEYYHGGTPYDNPKRYMELSPIFYTKGLNTAVLIESGQLSLAAQGLELTTALWRNGVPHESVIYPKSGHNLDRPQLMLESASRNLDWFDYWIMGKKDSDPAKREQYERWERMKGDMARMRMLKPVVQSEPNSQR